MRKMGIGLSFFVMLAVGCGGSPAAQSRTPGAEGASDAPARYPGVAAAAPPPAEAPSESDSTSAPAPGGGPMKSLAKDESAPSASATSTEAPIATAPSRKLEARRLPQSGQLTAGVWDDNRNFDFFKPYRTTFTASNGQDFAMFDEQELASARDLANGQASPHADLDVQLVLDTTGSMGDELAYLQGEFDAIATKVRAKFPNVTPRWSLVVYRDKGDTYVTRQFDFTTDTTRFRSDLRAQSAGGGGDTPEAVVEGLSAGLRQTWRPQNNVAKVAFWVADAPAHPGEGRVLANVIRDAKKKGVHLYPIASSDTDPAAEYQMRSAAQLTGGRYVFLTNDSGIGNDHAEPHIPCYNVTRLDNAIVRMIQVELTGRHIEPEANDVLRSVGRPNKEGKCQLPSGLLVASY
jgi:hypothetical protein